MCARPLLNQERYHPFSESFVMTSEQETRTDSTPEVVAPRTDSEAPVEDAIPDAVTGGRAGDPVVTVMLTGALALIAVLLATGALIFIYLNTLNDAPRTKVERDTATWETAVKERPDDENAWASLAYAYAEADRIGDALKAVARAKRVTGRSEFVIVEADVLRLGGRYSEAVRAYDTAEKAVRELQRRIEREREKIGVIVEDNDDALARVYYGRALSREELGDEKAAIRDLEGAVKLQPQSTTMWVALGDLYASSKETTQAQDAYRRALTFVPDDRGALEGLERLEGQAK